jgi:tetratricopeptide (TPR) repeat protein
MKHRFSPVRALVIALVFLALASVSQSTANARDNWTSVRTTNFLLVGNASEKEIRQVANRLEQFRKVFTMILPKLNFTSPVPTTVVVFKSDSSYKPFKDNPNVAGYFQAGEDVNYITLTTERYSEDNPFAVIFHEYTHLLVNNTMGENVPAWFNEGLAEYYSTFDVTDNNRKIVLGDLVRNHVLHLRQNKLIPLRTLFAVDHNSPYYNEGDKMNIFYAESWLLVHFLLQGNNKKRVPQMAEFLSLLRSNVPVDDAFQKSFQISYDAFEKEFKAYVDGNKYTGTTVTFEKSLDFDTEMKSAPLSEAEAQTYLGDLLLHTHHIDEAEARLQLALKLTPDLPMAQASLGMVRVWQGNTAEARQFLQKAAAANSNNYLVHYYYAMALGGMKMSGFQMLNGFTSETAEAMRAELKRAIELKPDFPESYTLLALVNILREEEIDESIDLLKQALTYSRANPRVIFMLAQLYERKQDFAGARQLLQPIVQNSPDQSMRQQARALLDNINRTEETFARIETLRKEATARGETVLITRTGSDAKPLGPPDSNAMLADSLRKTKQGETRIQGVLTAIECSNKGITFQVRAGERQLKLHTDNFEKMTITAFTADVSGEIRCGPRKPENPIVVTFVAANGNKKLDGEVVSLEFVPKDFVLKQ